MQKLENNIGIYEIINIENEKHYVGSSKNLKERKYRHFLHLRKKQHHSTHLQLAYDKYGISKFEFRILELCNEDELLDKETFWSNLKKSCQKDYGYNIAPEPNRHSISDETKQKISQKLKGHTVSDETRAQISKNRSGIPMTNEAREKLRTYWKSGSVSEETLEKMRKGRTGAKNTEEHNDLLRRVNTGSKRSKETKEKLREAWKRRKEKRLLALDKNHKEIRS